MLDDQFIQVGLIIKPHGLRGEVCVDYFADSPFLVQKYVWLKKGNAPLARHAVTASRTHKGRLLITLDDCRDRNAAEDLRNVAVFVPKEELPELTEEEVYLHTLEGLSVVLAESGSYLGTIDGFQFTLGSEVWHIRTEDNREVLFPVAEEFVTSIDLDAGVVTISPPPGLLELYLESD